MNPVLTRQEALGRPPAVVGGKASALARLAVAGLPVPDFCVLTAAASRRHLEALGLEGSGDPAGLRASIIDAPLPEEMAALIRQAAAGLGPRVAVRSSGGAEDSPTSSFAGQFDSFLSIDAAGLPWAVKACWASSLSDRALAYRAERGLPGGFGDFAVILQTQIYPEASGVLYTVSPLDPSAAHLEANYGTGESVVGSLATPDGAIIDRDGGSLLYRTGSKRRATFVSPERSGSRIEEVDEARRRERVLNDRQVREVWELGRRVEELTGCPQDIEWAIDAAGIWLLQSRPITAAA